MLRAPQCHSAEAYYELASRWLAVPLGRLEVKSGTQPSDGAKNRPLAVERHLGECCSDGRPEFWDASSLQDNWGEQRGAKIVRGRSDRPELSFSFNILALTSPATILWPWSIAYARDQPTIEARA